MAQKARVKVKVPHESELIAKLCRTPLTSESRAGIAQLLGGDLDWEGLLSKIASWEVEPVALHNLRTEFLDTIPVEYKQRVFDRERSARAIALMRGLVTLELVKSLDDNGIPVIVVKGASLAVMAYGDASMRTYSDIDLLVDRSDLVRARDFLTSNGYSPYYELADEQRLIRAQHALELSDSRNKVELHWALLSRHLRLDIESEELMGEAVRVDIAGSRIAALAPHHLMLFLCAHGAKHQWMNLRWICDVAQLSDRLSDDEMSATLELAEKTHARRILAFGLRTARDVLGATIPSRLCEALVPESQTRSLVTRVERRLFRIGKPLSGSDAFLNRIDSRMSLLLYWIRTRERLADKVGSISQLLRPG
jgi:hypothetical protein